MRHGHFFGGGVSRTVVSDTGLIRSNADCVRWIVRPEILTVRYSTGNVNCVFLVFMLNYS